MANSMLLGKYLPVDSLIHRIDARIKIIATLLFLTATFINTSLYLLLIILIFVIILTIVSKVGIKNLLSSLKPLRILIIFMVVFNIAFYREGNLLFEYKFIHIYDESITRTVFFVSRIVIMVMYTSILTLTTSPLDLSDGIESLLKPLEKFKFPAHEIGMMISIALRFIPTLFEETDKIMKAQASRGIDFKNGKIKEKIKGIVAMLIPLFINSLKRADDLANAMEIRGYTGGEGRTDLSRKKFGISEFIYLLAHLVLVLAFVVIKIWG